MRKRDYDFYTQSQRQIPKTMKESTSLKRIKKISGKSERQNGTLNSGHLFDFYPPIFFRLNNVIKKSYLLSLSGQSPTNSL